MKGKQKIESTLLEVIFVVEISIIFSISLLMSITEKNLCHVKSER